MVVRQHHQARVGVERVFHHPAHIDRHLIRAALRQSVAGEQLALRVQTGLVKDLPPLAEEQLDEIRADVLARVENDLMPSAARAHTAAEREEQPDKRRGVLTHALDLLQLVGRRGKHALERAEALDQTVRDGVRVLPRNGVIEQQLQRLMVGKGVQPMLAELLLFSLSVPLVYAHALTLSASFLKYIIVPHSAA